MSEEDSNAQIEGMKKLVELAQIRTNQSAERNYHNAERTLSVWIRTALAAMIFGIATDRLGLMLYEIPSNMGSQFSPPDKPSLVIGVVLVLFSMIMALASGFRFLAYVRVYKKQYALPAFHSEWPPAFAAFIVAIFGAALLVFMIWIG